MALVDDLYAAIGKTGGLAGGLVDQEGYDYWTNAFANGSKNVNDFLSSASSVYSNPNSYTSSPYATQNYEGLQNLLGGGGGGGGGATPNNPNLGAVSDDITRRVNLARDQGIQGIRGNAVGVGGLGGTRQGVAEGLAISGAADNLAGQLANMNLGAWNADANRELQRYQGDQSFYNTGRGLDLQSVALGSNLFNQGVQGQWSPINNANSTYSPYTGYGTSTNSSSQGGGMSGVLGGLLAGGQFARSNGWW